MLDATLHRMWIARRGLEPDTQKVLQAVLATAVIVGSSACVDSNSALGLIALTNANPRLQLACLSADRATVRPVAMWLPSDMAVTDTIVIVVSDLFASGDELGGSGSVPNPLRPAQCRYDAQHFGAGVGAPLLLGVTQRFDTLLFEVGAASDGRVRIDVDINGQLAGAVDVLMASDDLAHLSIGHRGA